MIKTLVATTLGAFLAMAGPALAVEEIEVPRQEWGFEGFFGTFDRGALQRGFEVYAQACHSCHSLNFIAFRHLQDIGLTAEQIESVAAQYEVEDGPDDAGDMFMRPARAANAGALPPDLSLMVRARPGGTDYLYALMIGYADEPPEGVEVGPGLYYNAYFPGHQIAMPPPLSEGVVEYTDGTEGSLEQYAHDVATFLAWTSYPELEDRKRLGVKVVLFLIALTALLFALKKKIWSDVH
jgi:cytochrome c1